MTLASVVGILHFLLWWDGGIYSCGLSGSGLCLWSEWGGALMCVTLVDLRSLVFI